MHKSSLINEEGYRPLLSRPNIIGVCLIFGILFIINAQGFLGYALNIRFLPRLLVVGALAALYLCNAKETNHFILQAISQKRGWFILLGMFVGILTFSYMRVGRSMLVYSSVSQMTLLFFCVAAALAVPATLSVVLYCVRERIDAMRALVVSVLAVLLMNVVVYGMGIQGRIYMEIGQSYGVEVGERFNPPLVENVYTTSFLGFTLVLYAMGILRHRFSGKAMVAGVVILTLGVATIYATDSRMYMAILPMAALLMLCSVRVGFICSMISFLFFIHIYPKFSYILSFLTNYEYFGDSAENLITASSRTSIWYVLWHEYLARGPKNMLFGEGYLSYLGYSIVEGIGLDSDRATFLINKLHPHSASLELLINCGIVGVLIFCAVLAYIFKGTYGRCSLEVQFAARCTIVIIATLGFVGNVVQFGSSFFVLLLLMLYLKIRVMRDCGQWIYH
jgi:hypothetical protein